MLDLDQAANMVLYIRVYTRACALNIINIMQTLAKIFQLVSSFKYQMVSIVKICKRFIKTFNYLVQSSDDRT